MAVPNIFLDTNIIVDYIVPSERIKYACSQELLERVRKGDFKAWSADYTLSETLGELKKRKEEQKGVKDILRETLSAFEIEQMAKIIEEFRKTPNLEVFEPKPTTQEKIFDKVKTVCVQATDALVLLSVLDLREKLNDIILTTRDGKLLVRAKRLVRTAHPIELIGSCPTGCTSKYECKFHR
jgi:predicted nucleic acid-binding protein